MTSPPLLRSLAPLLLCLLCVFVVNVFGADWTIAPVASTHKLTATAPGVLEPFPITPIQLQAARGEWECFQVVISAGDKPLQLTLAPTGLATHLGQYIPPANIALFRENYVFVAHPSGNARLEPLWWPDALIPLALEPQQSVAPHRSTVFWVALHIPADAVPGDYYGALDISANNSTRHLAVSLSVAPITLPPPSLRANVAVYYDALRDWYGKNLHALDDAEFALLKKQYYEFLLDYGLNAYDLPVAWNSDEAERYLHDPRVLSVRLPALDQADFPIALDRLKREKALGKAYYYWIDEPPPERFPEVIQTTRKLHAIDPAIKQCVTIHPNQSLKGAIDIWCPNIGDALGLGHLDFDALARERMKGRETWWYTMVVPKAPYPTWLLDDDAGAVRCYGWMMARWHISGFVYSMAHGWGSKPLDNLESFAGTNGDGTLLYPAELVGGHGPMPSIRLMLLRDAIEDYELLRTLPEKQRLALTSAVCGPTPAFHPPYERIAWPRLRAALFAALEKRPVTLPPYRAPDPPRLPLANDAITPAHGTPMIDGNLNDAGWNAASRCDATFQRFPRDKVRAPDTKLWLAHDKDHLFVAVRATTMQAEGEWVAVELAPLDASIRWRLVVTSEGKMIVEKHTREGQFEIKGLEWHANARRFNGFYNVEMVIPLSLVENASKFRLNVLRRANDDAHQARILTRAAPDAGDVTLMPIVRVG